MKKYRIKEILPGQFAIEQRFLFWWYDVSTPTTILRMHPSYKPLSSVQECKDRISGWQSREFRPVIHEYVSER
jgi:hypothetical protein